MTVPKWLGCLSFVGLAWAIGLPARIVTSAAARRNTCSWPHGVPSLDVYVTTLEAGYGEGGLKLKMNK